MEDLSASLEHSLKGQLRHEASAPLEHVLRALAPSRAAGAMPILWLDWGMFGAPPLLIESDPQYRNARFRCRLIPPLKDLELDEILDYLEHVSCPEGIAYELSKLIFAETKGHYEDTVTLLQQGQASWYLLKDKLGGGPRESGIDF